MPQGRRRPGGRARCRALTIGAVIAAALVAAPAAAGQSPAVPVAPYGATDGGGFRDVLPPGAAGHDQLGMYRDLLYAAPELRRSDLDVFFKDATFGVRPEERAAAYSPRPDVTIVRDQQFGVPHVYGANRDGAMFGLGYAAAEDRLFYMDVLRHAGRGELSSFAGGSYQAADAEQWRAAPYTEADLTAQFQQLPRLLAFRGQLLVRDIGNYVDGINAYIAAIRRTPSLLPPEYEATGNRQGPGPWTPEDVVATAAVVGRGFAASGGDELAWAALRSAVTRRLGGRRGIAAFRELRGGGGPRIRRGSRALPDGGSFQRSVVADPPPPPGPDALPAPLGPSGAVLLAGRASATKHPLMVAGPQVGYASPSPLMEQDVHAPATTGLAGIEARGAAFAGMSFYVQFGHGPSHAWSATAGGEDVADTFAVDLCDPAGGPPSLASPGYRFRGECLPIEVLARANRWRPTRADPTAAGTQQLRAERTQLGLVVARGTVRNRPVVFTRLRSTYLHELDWLAGVQALDEPASVHSPRGFLRAAAKIRVPSTWFFANSAHVASLRAGAVPVRARGVDGALPVRGERRYEWRGWDPITWTARTDGRGRHRTAVDRRVLTAPGELVGPRLRRARHMTLERLVSLTELDGTADPRARTDLPLALRLLGRQRDPQLREAVRALRDWLRAGGRRLDSDRDGAYDHADAIRLFDAWWPLWVRGQFEPSLGPEALAALGAAVGGDGASFGPGVAGLVSRDLRAALARRSRGHRRAFLCGSGRRALCRQVLAGTLREASAVPATALYAGRPGCADGDQACHDAIRFDHVGGGGGTVIPWVDRPSYQQAVSVMRRVPPPPRFCGEIRRASPRTRRAAPAPPLVIGDSVVMGALPEMAAAGFEVDARGCRGFAEGVEVIRQRLLAGTLPALVVMQLGTDGSVRFRQIREALKVLGRRRRLALVTPREVFGHSHTDAAAMRKAGRRYRKRVVVADWARYSDGHAGWFQPDEVHLTLDGARAFAAFVHRRLARRMPR